MDHRKSLGTEVPPPLDCMTNEQLNHWLARFIMEVRNQSGKPYAGGTLYGICAVVSHLTTNDY